MKQNLVRGLAALCAAALTVTAMPAAAEDEAVMTLRMYAEQTYVMQSALSEEDAVIAGALYIDNYSGICTLNLHMLSDEPLHIESGDFTRDPSRQVYVGRDPDTKEPIYEDKQTLFEDYSEARYTQHSDITGLENVVMWCSPGWTMNETAVLEDPDSSFLSFEIRVPKGTPAGQYRCYLATGMRELEGGKYSSEFYLTSDKGNVSEDVVLQPCTITVEPAALRGDVNCNGKIEAADAQRALHYYVDRLAQVSRSEQMLEVLFDTPFIHTAMEAADVDEDGNVSAVDAQCILQYYVLQLAGKTPNWDHVIPAEETTPGTTATTAANTVWSQTSPEEFTYTTTATALTMQN